MKYAQEGIALILALFTLTFVSLLSVAFLDIVTIDQQITTNYIKGMRSGFLADAGVETAVFELRKNENYTGTGGEVEYPRRSGNTYDVSVSGNTITSTGNVEGFSSTVEAGFILTPGSPRNKVIIDTWEEL